MTHRHRNRRESEEECQDEGENCFICSAPLPEDHPDRHRDHHQIFGKRHKAERHIAAPTNTGAFERAFVDIDGFENGNRAYGPNEQCEWDRDYRQPMGGHQQSRQPFGKRIDISIRKPFAGEQIIVEEHARKFGDVLQFEQSQYAHAE